LITTPGPQVNTTIEIGAEIRRWRADTPAADAGRIHLNNAGASLMPRPVLETIQEHLALESSLGGYEAADAAETDIGQAYDCVGALIGADRRNVAVVENATVAVAQALSAFDFAPGDTLVTTRNDYISNQLMYLSLARRTGLRIERAADLPEGGVDPDSVRALIREHAPKLVSVTWIPTNSGLVQPVQDVGEICAAAGVPYLVDACQAVGQLPVDVTTVRCDFLAATARKFLRGPRGIGFLYVSSRMLEDGAYPRYVDMRGARWIEADEFQLDESARRFENWEFSYALVLGLGRAARYATDIGMHNIAARVGELAAYTRKLLAALVGVRVLDRGSVLSGIVTAEIAGHHARSVMLRLREEAINTSATAREYAVLDMDDKRAETALRVSPHYYNTTREIDILVSALEEFVG
jgi:selenocysteine lyase/cysteine desulfurase